MEEKRKYMRFNVLLDALCKTGGALKKLTISNFSREGIGALSEIKIPKGEAVEIELSIPGDNIPVVVSGQIAWASSQSDKSESFKYGIKLDSIDGSDRGRVLNYIYRKWMMPEI